MSHRACIRTRPQWVTFLLDYALFFLLFSPSSLLQRHPFTCCSEWAFCSYAEDPPSLLTVLQQLLHSIPCYRLGGNYTIVMASPPCPILHSQLKRHCQLRHGNWMNQYQKKRHFDVTKITVFGAWIKSQAGKRYYEIAPVHQPTDFWC